MIEPVPRILVVDDDWLIREQMGHILNELGYQVAGRADTGPKAIQMTRDLQPNLILMDVVMPGGMNGIEAAEKIKADFDIPIIFISGYGDPEFIEKAKQTEPFGYLMKPLDEREIGAFVEIALYKSRSEKALRENEEKFRELVEGTDDLVIQINRKGRFTYVNHSAENIFGMDPDRILGMPALKFVHPEDLKKTKKLAIEGVRNRKRSITLENRQINQSNGKVCHICWTINIHHDDQNKPGYYSGIGRDLTDRKKMEEALYNVNKLKAIGLLAGGVAHDFNNLLASVLGNIGLAKLEVKPESKAYEKLVKAEKVCLQTKLLTARLITFSEGGEPHKEIVSIGDLLRGCIGSSLKCSDINYRFSIPDDISPVEVDVAQMRQVIDNVITNAHDAMAGKGTIHISTEKVTVGSKDMLTLKNGEYVKISIKDQGRGIPKKILGKIFDPYFTTKSMGAVKGMGLGLAISDSIVKKHGGLITATSRPGRCSTFSIYLPAVEAESEWPETGSPNGTIRHDTKGRPIDRQSIQRVLVMDDEEALREVAYSILKRLGYEVTLAEDGVEAVNMYKKAMASANPFDLVILDLTHKVGMGGLETIERLSKIDHAVRAVVTAGDSNNPIIKNFRQYGFSTALIKPFTVDELKNVFREVRKEDNTS